MTRITLVYAMTVILLISGCQPYSWYRVEYTSTNPQGKVQRQWIWTPEAQPKSTPPTRRIASTPAPAPKASPVIAPQVPDLARNRELARMVDELGGRVDEALVRGYWSPERLASLTESAAKVDIKHTANADLTRLWTGLGLLAFLVDDHSAADRFWSRVDRRVSDPRIIGSTAWPWTPAAIERFNRGR